MENVSKLLLILLMCYPLVSSQFPAVCRSNSSDPLTNGSGICCPLVNNEVCGGSQRGQCKGVNTTCNNLNSGNDPGWLLPYFSSMCVCQPTFSGVACEQCWYGFTATADGKSCISSSETRVRRDFLMLSTAQQENYIKVLQLMKYTPSSFYIVGANSSSSLSIYDYLSSLHYISMTVTTTALAHDGPAFPTWHRAYLLLFERLAQHVSGDPTFALPYIDEYNVTAILRIIELFGGDGLNISGCHTESVGERSCSCYLATEGPGSVFSSWQEIGPNGTLSGKISRALGCDRTAQTPPSATAINYAIENSIYSEPPWNNSPSLGTFSNLLEGYAIGPVGIRTEPAIGNPRDNHNRLHVYIGGTMKDVKTAASDPLFWLHHGFIDLMLEKWMRKHPTSMHPWTTTDAPPGHSYNDCQALFLPLLPQAIYFFNSSTYGYTYDQLFGPADSIYKPSALVHIILLICAGSFVPFTLVVFYITFRYISQLRLRYRNDFTAF